MEADQFGSYVSCFQCGASVAITDDSAEDKDSGDAVETVAAAAKSA